jgi:hypothetical protein
MGMRRLNKVVFPVPLPAAKPTTGVKKESNIVFIAIIVVRSERY